MDKGATSSPIAALAVIGRENNPLYIQSFKDGVDVIKFHYLIHTSLDIVNERGRCG